MTANQFNAALKKLGFCAPMVTGQMSRGHTEFARMLQLPDRSVRRWAKGEWPVPTPIAALVNLMLSTGSTAGDIKL
jgi:hypothetical protein